MPGSTKVLVPTPGLTLLPLATTILFQMIGAKGCSKVSFIRVKQARKPQSSHCHCAILIYILQGFSYTEFDTGPWLWLATGNNTNGTETIHWVGIAEPGMYQL